ncbi:exonuclease mut-7 homolog isoform X11 [Orcinus orca]|uniref:exonuclease mut-7 homolog isoform X11 n=1 Tax=Orcinus orca TaxID=9733 RepID=UPI002112AAF0|nr:exonuclease mut-7 homolog isoform X11 [Orcinus orca]
MSTLCTEGPRARPPSSARPPVVHPCVEGAGLAHSRLAGWPRAGHPVLDESSLCRPLVPAALRPGPTFTPAPGPLQLQLGLPGCLPMATEAGDLVCVCKSGLGTSSSHYRVSLKAWATALNRANMVTAGSWQHREGTDSKPTSHVQCQAGTHCCSCRPCRRCGPLGSWDRPSCWAQSCGCRQILMLRRCASPCSSRTRQTSWNATWMAFPTSSGGCWPSWTPGASPALTSESSPDLCPNVITQQRLAALRYLCYKRLVEGLVGQDQWLQEQLLQLLTSHDNTALVAQCALDLLLPEERLPASVAAELRQLRIQERTAEAPLEDGKDDYYQLPIPREHLHFLASWEDLARHQEELLQPGQVVGMDLEWRPSFGAGGRPRASLMQVAVEGRVFLLDLPQLSSPAGGQAPQAFFRLVSRLLADPSITKLGYGLAGDLRSLGASCPALAQAEKQLRGSVDLLQVHRQMRAADRPAPGVDGAAGPRGLSLLVQQVLGKPLDKVQQLSNWDRRPLCEGQLVYAAADAYCLLEVYWAVCREPARFHLSGDLARSLRLGRGERAGPGELPPLQKASTSPQQVPAGEDAAPEVPARAFRVVCDSMLQGLARRLRCLGIDVLVLATGEDHRRAAEVARQEGRVILTSGLPYHKLRAQVGAGRCLSVDCSLKARQQATAVIRHFNVRVTHSDIFSRCQACNCHQYLKVSKDVMKQLVWLSGHPEGPSGTGDEAAQIEDERETGSAPEEAPGGCTYEPSCRWLEEEDLQSRVPATLGDGTRLQLSGVPAGVLRRPGLRHFYCCTGCGKVFWEGSHLGRVAENFREVLEGVPGSREPSRAPSPASSPS